MAILSDRVNFAKLHREGYAINRATPSNFRISYKFIWVTNKYKNLPEKSKCHKKAKNWIKPHAGVKS